MNIRFDITPVAKPRMTRRDQWKDRAIVGKYYAFRDQIRFSARAKGLYEIPEELECITFNIPMPPSWPSKHREEMNGQPHTIRPDIDNFLKGFLDCFMEDKHVHRIGELRKIWSETGSIELCLSENILDENIQVAYNVLND